MGKIAPLNQITGLGYAWLKEQVGETLAFNYFELFEKKKQKEKYELCSAYMYFFLFPLFLTEGLIFQVFVLHGNNPLVFWQDIWQLIQFFLAVSVITFLGLFYLHDKDEGFYILSRLYFNGIIRDYDGWFVLLFFLSMSGALFYSSFLAGSTMKKLFFLFGVLILGLCFAFFRGVEWAYLRYSQLYDRLLWLNSQVKDEPFRKALERLYGTRTEFRYNHGQIEIPDKFRNSPLTDVVYSTWINEEAFESVLQSWKNEGEGWYQRVWFTFTSNYFIFWMLFANSQRIPEDERIQRLVLFVLLYFLIWIAQWVIRGKPGEILSSLLVLLAAGGSGQLYKTYYALPIVHYFAILFALISGYLILRSRYMAQLIENYKKKKGTHE